MGDPWCKGGPFLFPFPVTVPAAPPTCGQLQIIASALPNLSGAVSPLHLVVKFVLLVFRSLLVYLHECEWYLIVNVGQGEHKILLFHYLLSLPEIYVFKSILHDWDKKV